MSEARHTPVPLPLDPDETATPPAPPREDPGAPDTRGIPAIALTERERRSTPVALERVASALAIPPKARPEGPEEVADEELEIVDAQAAGPPAPIPPIPAEASGPKGLRPGDGAAGEAQVARLRLPTPPPLPSFNTPEALAQRTRRKRGKPWFEEVFDEDYLRTLPFMTAGQTLRETSFLEESLALPKGGEVLDVACGYGRHAIELVQRGYKVTGLDLSLPLLIRAADESQRRSQAVNFVHADMREMAFESQFDGAYSMLTSFGYFDEDTNHRVAEGIARALKPGGRFVIDVVNRDYVVAGLPSRAWWEGDGCVVVEEVEFSYHTSRLLIRRSIVFEDGRQREHELSIRAYSLHELGKLLRGTGFRVLEVSGSIAARGRFFGSDSRNLLVLCEKRPEADSEPTPSPA